MSTIWDPHGLYSSWNSPGQNTGVDCLSLLQAIFPTQGSKPGLPHCRWILYQLTSREVQEYWSGQPIPSPGCLKTYHRYLLFYLTELSGMNFKIIRFTKLLKELKLSSETDRQSRLDAWDKCSGLVHWDDPEGWDGEGGGRGVQDG